MHAPSGRLPMPGPAFGPYPERSAHAALPRRWLPVVSAAAQPAPLGVAQGWAQAWLPSRAQAQFLARVRQA